MNQARSRLLLAVGVTALLGGALVLAAGALAALPALLAFLPLLGGRYPGCARLERAIGARRGDGHPRRAAVRRPRLAPRCVPRGGRLIAASLAERGPPPLSASA